MQKLNVTDAVISTEFMKENVSDLYSQCLHFISYLQGKFVFPFDKSIQLEDSELRTMIIDSYIYFPAFSFQQRMNYVIGLSAVTFASRKVDVGYLCPNMIYNDIISMLSSFPTLSSEMFLGVKEGMEIRRWEDQYHKTV